MEISKLSQDEIDQLNFDGDLSAPSYNDADIHGNISSQLPGGAVALCTKYTLENDNTSWFVYGGGSTGPLNYGGGGGGGYQTPNVQIFGGVQGGSHEWQIVIAVQGTY
jgi:outer membrane usher protein FimD/PapC